MALSVSCTCCALVRASAECCGSLCHPSAVKRLWPLWSNPVPLSLIRCTCVVPLFLRCCVICHMVLIAQCGKVLRLPLRSYRLYNRISQFRFDSLPYTDRPYFFLWNPRCHHDITMTSPTPLRPHLLHYDLIYSTMTSLTSLWHHSQNTINTLRYHCSNLTCSYLVHW